MEPDSGNRHTTASEFCTEDATKPNGKSEKSLNAPPWKYSDTALKSFTYF